MNKYPIELIPAIIKGSRPSQYEGESFTALEYVSKIAVKINECINEYNGFVDDVIKEFETFKNGELTDRDVFERRIEQMITDFKEVIRVKYKEQDTAIVNGISEMLNSLPDNISKALTQMYSNGQFDAIVYNSIANLKRDFDSIVNNSNTFQSTINESFINLVADMELFKTNTRTEFNELEQSITEMFDSFVADSGAADMQKSTYDTNNNGIVDNSENLGGNPPEYFAKKQELESLTNTVGALNNSVNNVNTQVNTMQITVNDNASKVNNANNTANNALVEAQKKLGITEQAVDSLRLNGEPASYYASADLLDSVNVIANNANSNAKNALDKANSKKPYTYYVDGTQVSINDITSDGNCRMYIYADSADANYLGWYGNAQVETFRVNNSENRLYQRITHFDTGVTQVRFCNEDKFTYSHALKTVSAIGNTQKYVNTTKTVSANTTTIISSVTVQPGTYLIIGVANFEANNSGRRACWITDGANTNNWISNRVTQVNAVTSGDSTSINTVTIEKYTEETVVNLTVISSASVSVTGVLRLIKLG